MIEIISFIDGNEQFRIWQRDADGFSIEEWMVGPSADSQNTTKFVRNRAALRHEFFGESLKNWKYPESRDLSERIKTNCTGEMLAKIYRESRSRYGMSQILNLQLLVEFLNFPCTIGGGIGIFNHNKQLSEVHLYRQ